VKPSPGCAAVNVRNGEEREVRCGESWETEGRLVVLGAFAGGFVITSEPDTAEGD
jgi:hypothetical protein